MNQSLSLEAKMVWNTKEEVRIKGKTELPDLEAKSAAAEAASPSPASQRLARSSVIPKYMRLQMPLAEDVAAMRRMADEMRSLAAEIDYCITRDIKMDGRLYLIHQAVRALNQRWSAERDIRERENEAPAAEGH